MKKLIAIIAAVMLASGAISSQNTRCFNVTSGLSENTVKGIVQDKTGYIWLGTQDGLNVFNGHEFRIFGCSYRDNGKPESLNIMCILLHLDGNQIWIAARDAVYLFDPERSSFLKMESDAEIAPTSLVYDESGSLLVGCQEGLFRLDESGRRLIDAGLCSSNISSLFCDSRGILWICGDDGLFFKQPGKNKLEAPVSRRATASVAEDRFGNIWVGMWYDGLAMYDKETRTLHDVSIKSSHSTSPLRVRSLMCDNDGSVLLCTSEGLFRYRTSDGTTTQTHLSSNSQTDNVYTCIRDREGGLWIGTYFSGLFYAPPQNDLIQCFSPATASGNFAGTAVSSFCEDEHGRVWVGTENGGLSLFDLEKREFSKPCFDNPAVNIHVLYMDGPFLYAGTFAQGLKRIDTRSGKTITYTTKNGLSDNHVFSLVKISSGRILIGTRLGCDIYNPASGEIESLPELKGSFIYDICEDRYGSIWFATYYSGLFRYRPLSGAWTHFTSKSNNLPSNRLVGLFADDENHGGRLWVCSDGGGAFTIDPSKEEPDAFKPGFASELPSVVYSIGRDSGGTLWMSTNNGLYNCTDNGELRHFTFDDGLQSNQFNYKAIFHSSDGKLYFGGINGFNVISPDAFKQSFPCPPATVTAGISTMGSDIEGWAAGIMTSEKEIVIPRGTRSFTLNLELLSYITPGRNEYEYCIDGRKEKQITDKQSVSFVDFPYGKHTIAITATNGKGVKSANSAVLKINNLPPIGLSLIAKIFYFIIILSIIVSLAIWYRKRKEENMERNSYLEKINFFTQIAHEIKTPVTLIKAPLEMVMKNPHSDAEKRDLEIIDKNTTRLINLISQLLDFKKVSAEGYRISMETVHPKDVVRSVTSRFEALSLKGIDVELHIEDNIPNCLLDPEAYIKIVSNLMTNALKHTRTFIKVYLSLSEGSEKDKLLHLSVEDNGEGIPEKECAKIFDSFYQVGKVNTARMGGVGLGLSLVKLLAEKHNGKVYVDTAYKEGCRMCVDVPYIEENTPSQYSEPDQTSERQEVRVLVVEDNRDMLDFICNSIQGNYSTLKAVNGREALLLMKDADVDIVISDISMPEMDGFEMLKEIRNSEILSHIPVILLTAESSLGSKIKGLDYGCNAYIEKPFSVDQLLATINNILSNRELLRRSYLDDGKSEDLSESRIDSDFLDRLTSIIKEKTGESDIPVDELAEYMNMSKSSLQRKVKGLTGLTPVEFVRHLKLKKAAELLQTGKYRVNEVCYMVGFNKPSYFTACFKNQFGSSPKDWSSKEHAKQKKNDE